MAISQHGKPGKGNTDTWLTPPWLLEKLGKFDLDPCPPNGSNGLKEKWTGRIWLNPPYSKNSEFMKLMGNHGNGIALVFARTETKWFQENVFGKATAILFFNKRLKFFKEDGTEAKGNAGAPSVLVAYGNDNAKVLESLNDLGPTLRILNEDYK